MTAVLHPPDRMAAAAFRLSWRGQCVLRLAATAPDPHVVAAMTAWLRGMRDGR